MSWILHPLHIILQIYKLQGEKSCLSSFCFSKTCVTFWSVMVNDFMQYYTQESTMASQFPSTSVRVHYILTRTCKISCIFILFHRKLMLGAHKFVTTTVVLVLSRLLSPRFALQKSSLKHDGHMCSVPLLLYWFWADFCHHVFALQNIELALLTKYKADVLTVWCFKFTPYNIAQSLSLLSLLGFLLIFMYAVVVSLWMII